MELFGSINRLKHLQQQKHQQGVIFWSGPELSVGIVLAGEKGH